MASQGQQVLAGRALHRRTLDRDAVGNYLDPIRLHTERHQLVGHVPADGDKPSGGTAMTRLPEAVAQPGFAAVGGHQGREVVASDQLGNLRPHQQRIKKGRIDPFQLIGGQPMELQQGRQIETVLHQAIALQKPHGTRRRPGRRVSCPLAGRHELALTITPNCKRKPSN